MNPDCFSTSGEPTKGRDRMMMPRGGERRWMGVDRKVSDFAWDLFFFFYCFTENAGKKVHGLDIFFFSCFRIFKYYTISPPYVFVYPLLNHRISVLSGSWKHLNRELCVKIVKAPWGIRPLIPVNLRNAAAQCPSFLSGNKISPLLFSFSPFLSSFLTFSQLFFFSSSSFCTLLSSVFHFNSNPKYLRVHPSLWPVDHVTLSKHKGLLRSGRHFNCTVLLQDYLCHLLHCSSLFHQREISPFVFCHTDRINVVNTPRH